MSSNVIPQPVQYQSSAQRMKLAHDARVSFAPDTAALLNDPQADDLLALLNARCGTDLQRGDDADAAIQVRVRAPLSDAAEEAYELIVDADAIRITANSASAVLYAFESLAQLARPTDGGGLLVACGIMNDSPRFAWRGLMLDVTRHFQSVATVKRVLDLLSALKLNRLHLHLCDDEAWRLEIPGYPRLTKVAAWRPGADGPEGGFYTADDIAEILTHARRRGVTVIPEIEMPAHCNAALVAYPELGCDGPLPIAEEGGWDAFQKKAGRRVFCCGEPAVFTFLENVLRHVDALFDSETIHLGGDERPARAWTACPKCRRAMAEANVKTEAQMQAAFMERVSRFVREELGRRTTAWADNLREGAPQGQIVHGWYPGQSAAAARLGHTSVNSSHEWTYLDYPPTRAALANKPDWMIVLPIEKVYHFDPIPDGLEPELHHLVLGSEAALWTEHLPDEAALFDHLLPRLAAFAEALWSPRLARSYDDFALRLEPWLSQWRAEARQPTRITVPANPARAVR